MVPEILVALLMEAICETTHKFSKRYEGEGRAPESWYILRFVFQKKSARTSSEDTTRWPTERQRERRQGVEVKWTKDQALGWSDIESMCGSWDGSFKVGSCGVGLWVAVRVVHDAWQVIHKAWVPAFGGSNMDAEEKGCGMLVEMMLSWPKYLTPGSFSAGWVRSAPEFQPRAPLRRRCARVVPRRGTERPYGASKNL